MNSTPIQPSDFFDEGAYVGNIFDFINEEEYKEMKEYLREIAGPDIFLSFVDDWENMETNTPPLSINPKAQFHTPHGLYFFPLDKINVESVTFYPSNASQYPDVDAMNADIKKINKNDWLCDIPSRGCQCSRAGASVSLAPRALHRAIYAGWFAGHRRAHPGAKAA